MYNASRYKKCSDRSREMQLPALLEQVDQSTDGHDGS